MDEVAVFALGVLVGLLVCWLVYRLYWPRWRRLVERDVSYLRAKIDSAEFTSFSLERQLNTQKTELAALHAKISILERENRLAQARLEEVNTDKQALITHLETLRAELAAYKKVMMEPALPALSLPQQSNGKAHEAPRKAAPAEIDCAGNPPNSLLEMNKEAPEKTPTKMPASLPVKTPQNGGSNGHGNGHGHGISHINSNGNGHGNGRGDGRGDSRSNGSGHNHGSDNGNGNGNGHGNADWRSFLHAPALPEQILEPILIIARPRVGGDRLEIIQGIGPAIVKKLNKAGIDTFLALSLLTPERFKEILGPRAAKLIDAQSVINQAKKLVGDRRSRNGAG